MKYNALLSCPKVRFKHVGCVSGCVFNIVPMNIQAAEVLTSDVSSEISGPLMFSPFLSHDNMEKQQSNTCRSKQNKDATANRQQTTNKTNCNKTSIPKRAHTHNATHTETLRYTETKQQRLHCVLRSPWFFIKICRFKARSCQEIDV